MMLNLFQKFSEFRRQGRGFFRFAVEMDQHDDSPDAAFGALVRFLRHVERTAADFGNGRANFNFGAEKHFRKVIDFESSHDQTQSVRIQIRNEKPINRQPPLFEPTVHHLVVDVLKRINIA